MENIVFVTSNDNKLREIEEALGIKLQRASLDLDEIQDMDVAKIVEHKVRQAYAEIKQPVMVEDVGLYLDAWGGFPGPFIKWLHSTMGYDTLTAILPTNNRKVRWIAIYGYFDGDQLHCFEGVTDGTIAEKQQGSEGWGFDTIFIPDGEKRTFAEMGSPEKLKYSARRHAVTQLRDFLQKK